MIRFDVISVNVVGLDVVCVNDGLPVFDSTSWGALAEWLGGEQ